MDALPHSETNNIEAATLIIHVSNSSTVGQLDHDVWQYVRALGTAKWRCQVLLVDSSARMVHDPVSRWTTMAPITYRPLPTVLRCFRDALTAAKYPTIIVADVAATLESNQWTAIASRRSEQSKTELVSQPPVQAVFGQTLIRKRYQSILLGAIHGVTRCLLGTKKSAFKPGWVVLNQAQSNRLIAATGQTLSGPANRAELFTNTTELLAMARLIGLPVEETEISGEVNRSSTVVLSSSSNGEQVENPDAAMGLAEVNTKQLLRSFRETIRFWWNQSMFPLATVDDSSLRQKPTSKTRWLAGAALLSIASLLLFSNLNYPLFEPDEARNSQLAMNVIESGDWMSLTLAGEPYWDKPPGQIWAIAVSYQLFGISPWATRLPVALATLMAVCLTLLVGQRLVGYRAAFVGAIALLMSCGFVLVGRYVTMDASLTACMTLMSGGLMLRMLERRGSLSDQNMNPTHDSLLLTAHQGEPSSTVETNAKDNYSSINIEKVCAPRRARALFAERMATIAGIAAGIGLMIKGPVVLVLGLPPVLMAYWLAGNLKSLKQSALWFFVPMMLIAAPWFLAMALIHPDFLTYFFWKHHVMRFSEAFNHREPMWYYIPAILIMMFPASYFLPSLIRFISSRKSDFRNQRTPMHGFLLLQALWIIGFFSLSESKLPTYIMPALPSICLLIGVMLDKRIFSSAPMVTSIEASAKILKTPQPTFLSLLPQRAPFGFVLIGIIVLLLPLMLDSDSRLPLPIWALTLITIGMSAIAIIPWQARSRIGLVWSSFAIAGLVCVFTCINWLTPEIAHSRSIHGAIAHLKRMPELDSVPVVFFGREDYGAEMVVDETDIVNFKNTQFEDVCKFLEQQPQAIIVSSAEEMKTLREVLPWKVELKSSQTTRHLHFSFHREQPPIATQPNSKPAAESTPRTARSSQWKIIR